MDSAFTKWRDVGIRKIGDLFIDGSFVSFSQLQAKYGLHKNNFFRYLQLRDYVRKHLSCLDEASSAKFDELLGLGGGVT